MLRVVAQANAAAAQSYYQGSKGEYYAEGQEQSGEWGGRGAELLGLNGAVSKEAFSALCENRHPETGERITPRTKSVRRVGFDLNFHIPKSASVVYGLTGDREILEAFKSSVRETLSDMERETRTRVRTGGKDETRTTGNFAYSLFIHATARPVGGIPDPHLHAHAFTFNLTFDEMENRWKALELGEVYKNAPFYEAVFHARFAGKLSDLGFDISRTATGWEISGIPDRVLKLFSRRTEQIEAAAKELGVTNSDLKWALGAKTRERKQLGFTLDDLKTIWRMKLSPSEQKALDTVIAREVMAPGRDPHAARDAMRFAIEHSFERSSVIPVNRLLGIALKHGVGQVTLEGVQGELKAHGLIVKDYHGERLATTREVLAEETRVLQFGKQGRNSISPLACDFKPVEGMLSPQQSAAVKHVLGSTDRVILVRGVAGSGKTTLIRSCVEAIIDRPVLLLAPSSEASRNVLRKEGFSNADTVARFLLDARLQESVRNGVVWVDEAGLLGIKSMDSLFQVAAQLNARVVLSGDEKQHQAVERGSPFALLQNYGGLQPATIKEIRRQTGRYKDAVSLLAAGQVLEGFDVLDIELGWVAEIDDLERPKEIAREYLKTSLDGKTVLVVSPTHAEGRAVTKAIRDSLKSSGRISTQEKEFIRLEARDLTQAERGEARYYRVGDVVEFHTQCKGFRPGSRFTVTTVGRSSIAARNSNGSETIIPLKAARHFQVYTHQSLSLSIGDRVRISKNGKSKNQKRLDNGSLHWVKAISNVGGIELDNGAILGTDYAHIAYGYAVTSHSSQGKTVDRVLVAQSSVSFAASTREQFYVSISRGRDSVTVYTDDKARLRRSILRSDPSLSATELVMEQAPAVHIWRAWVAKRLQFLRSLWEGNAVSRSPTPELAKPVGLSP